ncbi:glycoside hydrolase family protein [Lutibacter citreus]|uniref:glycoside hydrolase family protein n=1 Tax=Lutibacter citreus TaxID=2138210 RepID=UPI0015D03A53|nr:glycoside hydrolase family protein [Lutibacter citreus]
MNTKFLSILVLLIITVNNLVAQDVERSRPKEWDGLVEGSRFIDRFLPIPKIGKKSSNTWGAKEVIPRYMDNGIEDKDWSYWGGNKIQGEDGKYHQFVCRWREDSEKGHMEWPRSEVTHVVSDNLFGPFKYVETIGKGHNPEIYKIKDGRFVISVNGGYYLSESLNGPWGFLKFEYDQREKPILDHFTNNTFAQREDGSYLMVSRGGEVLFSETGLPPFYMVTDKSNYPPYEGRYEDPVIWRTNIQYHMIVNDWMGRIAYYQRSKDGIHWKLDAGEAYLPGIAKYEDKTLEDWYKFERMKVFQDIHGRAIQANFAVADTIKRQDKGSDNHSSKNIGIPLTVGKLITILNTTKIDANTKTIRLKIQAEEGFNPQKDLNIKSLRFGASEVVNFGGGSKVIEKEKVDNDLVLTFEGLGNGITEENFAGKLLGKTRKGKMLFGYARLPWLDYNQQALSSKYPVLELNGNHLKVSLEIENFGQVTSIETPVKIYFKKDGKWIELATGNAPALKPFEKTIIEMSSKKFAEIGELATIRVIINQKEQKPSTLEGNVIIR